MPEAAEERPLRPVLLALLRAAGEELESWHGPALRGEDDAVHRLRVAARSLRSVLGALAPALEPAPTEVVVEDLRTLGQVLGPARDAEVLREGGLARLAQAEERLVPVAVAGSLRRLLEEREEAAQARARAALDGAAHERARQRIRGFLADPPLTAAAQEPAAAALRAGVDRQAGRLRRRIAAAEAAEGDDRLEALHRVRKAAKTLRYTLAAVAEADGSLLDAHRAAWQDAAHHLQDVLGDHRDSAVLLELVLEAAQEARAIGTDTFGHGVLAGQELAAQSAALAEYAEALTDPGLPGHEEKT